MTLFKKMLLAMLLLSIIPLLASTVILAVNLVSVREKLKEQTAKTADLKAAESLEQSAEHVAQSITVFLKECEADLTLVADLPRTSRNLKSFYESRKGEVWRRRGLGSSPPEIHEWMPRYDSLAITDRNGRETFVIKEGGILPKAELRDVSNPSNTEFKSEEYFRLTKQMDKGDIYVSHLTGFHISKEEQLAGATTPEKAFNGKEYHGVIRFATPLFDERGRFDGIAVLSLDHRHLMEFSQHIIPGQNSPVVFPSYLSGNYAFIFDDEGWVVTHPKFWDIRGVDRAGKLLPPYSPNSTKAEIESGRIPFNMDHAAATHPNFPLVARLTREKSSGHLDITNMGGATRVMAFAPILYDTGDYSRYGVFGGVTIGFQVDQFHEMARTGASLITRQLQGHILLSMLILFATSLMVGICAWLLSRGITKPLAVLTEGVRLLAEEKSGNRVEIHTGGEVGELAATFNKMAEDLEQRKKTLLTTLAELELSRKEIMDERNFKESVLESISSGILTFSADGVLTSINGNGRYFLGAQAAPGARYAQVFQGWDAMTERVARVLAKEEGYGREQLTIEREGKTMHFGVGFFPIGERAARGITITMRDETEKERMREEMIRMDRLASLGKLSAGIAHEVRNPLTGISLLLDDLHDRGPFDPESQGLMRKALGEIERVERLVAALLNFSSPPKALFREGDLDRVMQDTLLLLRRECESKGVELRFSPGNIQHFRFDLEKIKQAVLNLVKNALQALPPEGKIEVSTAETGDMAIIKVADNGPGISHDDLPFIFEPFFSRKGAGTGLGLSITQQIVEEHQGKIAVESAEGIGTTFIISLPMVKP